MAQYDFRPEGDPARATEEGRRARAEVKKQFSEQERERRAKAREEYDSEGEDRRARSERLRSLRKLKEARERISQRAS